MEMVAALPSFPNQPRPLRSPLSFHWRRVPFGSSMRIKQEILEGMERFTDWPRWGSCKRAARAALTIVVIYELSCALHILSLLHWQLDHNMTDQREQLKYLWETRAWWVNSEYG
jgi:hypothetical protein